MDIETIQVKQIKRWHEIYELYVKSLTLTDGDVHFLLSVSEDFKNFVERRVKWVVSKRLKPRERKYMLRKKFIKQILKPLAKLFSITPTMDGRDGKERFRR